MVVLKNSKARVAVAGLGAIGAAVVRELDRGIEGLALAAVSARNIEKHRPWLDALKTVPEVLPIEKLAEAADIVVECAPSRLVRSIVAPVVARGKTAIVLSVGALLENEDLIDLAKENGGQIVVPTGALIGLDAVTAAAEGTIHSVRMVTRKPLQGLAGAPHLIENNLSIEGLTEPLRIFEGTAREAAKGFPANLNVAVALSLAGIGPDRTQSGDLGGPDRDAQHPPDRGRFRLRAVFDVDREHPVGKSAHRPDHRTLGDRLPAQAARLAADRDVRAIIFGCCQGDRLRLGSAGNPGGRTC